MTQSSDLAELRRPTDRLWLRRVRAYPAASIVIVYGIVLVVAVAWSLSAPGEFSFAAPGNLSMLAQQIPITAIVAIGVGLLMISGEFDISTAGSFTLVAFVVATTFGELGWPLPFALAAGLVAALAVGATNGFTTSWLGIPSFIATIGMMFFLRGVIRFISINPQTNMPDSMAFNPSPLFESVMTGQLFGPIYAQLIWLTGIGIAAYLVLNRHQLGNHMFTVGGNRDAATGVGVNVRRTKLIAFMICASTAGFAGVLQATRIHEIEPSFATISGLELKAIAAVVVGGVNLFGGRGTVLGMILGAALIETADNILVLVSAPEIIFKGLLGALIIVAVAFNGLVARRIGASGS
ncbi:MAG: ABC transporter permease [Hyphomicrobiales bacterium]|nr:ABC transporter permease [Hyphomicrobiales bacterium]